MGSARSVTLARRLLLGLAACTTANPNLVEGREFFTPSAIALDTTTSPPILYVADTNNNRILAWKNATAFTNGKAADLTLQANDVITVSRRLF
jgi:sugar lactone lactonase YvrE